MASSIQNTYTIAPGITATFTVDASGVATNTGSGYISIANYDPPAVFGSGSGTTINAVLGELNQGLTDAQNRETLINGIIADAQADLNNPNISPSQRKWAEGVLDPNGDYQITVVAQNTAKIAAYQTSIAWVNSNFNTSMTQAIADATKEFPPANATPVPTTTANAAVTTANATTETTATGTKAPVTGVANDDSGATKPGTTKTLSPGTPGGAGSPGAPSTGKNGNAPVTKVSPTNTNASTPVNPTNQPSTQPVSTDKPGKRLKNPLGQFASYTYQISLYMITPDAFDLFVASGRTNINAFKEAGAGDLVQRGELQKGGTFLVAQSGGINSTDPNRAPGFQYDYYIDNLQITTQTAAKSGGSSTNISDIKFTITEPFGFSFISNLRRASDALNTYSSSLGTPAAGSVPENPSKQFFILGIRFYGYDQAGALVKPDSSFNGEPLDPASSDGSLFEHFYDISITSINFKLDGRMTTYQCEAVQIAPKTAFGVKSGLLISEKTPSGPTVGSVLQKLLDGINQEQQKNKGQSILEASTYTIVYAPGAEIIRDSSIVSPADLDKSRLPGSTATTTREATASTEGQANNPNTNAKSFSFTAGQPILQCIDQTIKQSNYLRNALTVVYASSKQSDPQKKAPDTITGSNDTPISWYTCSSSVKNGRWDNKQKEWVFDIEYTINVYETPVVDSTYVASTSKYYGPHKRYEYWYTGENSEIISYEQSLDNTWFNVVVAGTDTGNSTTAKALPGTSLTGTTQSSQSPTVKSGQDSTGAIGPGLAAQNSYVTSLYDPGSLAQAELTIMGDPDYLIETSTASSVNSVYSQFYGTDGFTINANGGQVFIEIDFKEGVDYVSSQQFNAGTNSQTEAGTFSINDSILFWKYPQSVAPIIQGISYQVISVDHTFKGGSFKQHLSCVINDFGDPDAKNGDGPSSSSISGPNADGSGTTPGPAGTTPDKPRPNPPPPGGVKLTTPPIPQMVG